MSLRDQADALIKEYESMREQCEDAQEKIEALQKNLKEAEARSAELEEAAITAETAQSYIQEAYEDLLDEHKYLASSVKVAIGNFESDEPYDLFQLRMQVWDAESIKEVQTE